MDNVQRNMHHQAAMNKTLMLTAVIGLLALPATASVPLPETAIEYTFHGKCTEYKPVADAVDAAEILPFNASLMADIIHGNPYSSQPEAFAEDTQDVVCYTITMAPRESSIIYVPDVEPEPRPRVSIRC